MPASSSRRRRTSQAAKAFLDWFAGPGRPGDPRAASGSCRRRDRARRRPRAAVGRSTAERPRGRAAGASARSPPSPRCSRCSSGCRSSRSSCARSSMGSLAAPLGSPVVLDALCAQPGHDRDQPRHHGRARPAAGLRPRAPPVPRQGLARGHRRPADRPAAVGRRAGAAARLRSAGPARRAVRAPRHLGPVHDDRGDPGPDVRVGAVLHPLGADRDRRRRSRPRGRRPRRRRVGAPAVPVDHGAACRAPRWPPASS